MTQVLRISLPGENVLGTTDPLKLSFDSEQFQHMMRLQGFTSASYTIPGAPGLSTVTIPHSLGYAPFFQVYVQAIYAGVPDPQGYRNGTNYCIVDDGTVGYELHPLIDDTNLYLRFFSPGGADFDINYSYMIGRDPI